MSALALRLKERSFGDYLHPYAQLVARISEYLKPDATLLDAGCGRTAPTLAKFRGRAKKLIGVDLVEFTARQDGIELRQRDLADTGVAASSIDLMYSQAVMEHVADPDAVFAEIARALKPGGAYLCLTANKYDYASLIARIVPNRFHPWIVNRVEGRQEHDVFPTVYKANTRKDVAHYAARAGLELAEFSYVGQYPSYFLFNGPLFFLATLYQKLIERVAPLYFLQGWAFFVLSKPAEAEARVAEQSAA
jgi:SAM-dependent methyltransferase